MNNEIFSYNPHGESIIDISLVESEKERQLLLEWLNSYDKI